MPDPRDTPAMRQYYRFKRQHPDCLLLFRIGDFYEMFDDDAVRASKLLGLTLTQRTEGVPMAGMPFHQVETYIRRAVEQGVRVAVCDQVQDASEVKGTAIIERAVTRVLTPGTLVDETLLDAGQPRQLGAVCFTESGDDSGAACAVLDVSTGAFEVFEAAAMSLIDELARRNVSELLYPQTADDRPPARVAQVLSALNLSGTPQPAWHFRLDEAREALVKLYGVSTLAGFGLADDEPVVRAAGAVVRYLQMTQLAAEDGAASTSGGRRVRSLAHLRPPTREALGGACVLDATTLRSLEVVSTIRERRAAAGGVSGEPDGSLLGLFAPSRTFAGCRTAMGRRLLRDWLCRPLGDGAKIRARQGAVATLLEDRRTAEALAKALEGVQDLPRIGARLALARATPRDLVALGTSLSRTGAIVAALENAPALAGLRGRVQDLAGAAGPLAERIARSCVDAPPAHLREGGLIRAGVDAELDEARLLQSDAASWMAEYQKRLIDEHQLPSLKVGYNKIFGYYIELPAGQARRAPDAFSRKQTLKNAERYITPELKEFEIKVSSAESRALAREQALFDELCAAAGALLAPINALADACAELDVLLCLADKAAARGWIRPEIVDEPVLIAHQARHPVLDELLGSGFVPNDIELGGPGETKSGEPGVGASLALITGPNMAGKSTYIRTAALVTLLAHTGSFVPADRATVGLTDRIFTRIGADDALHAGQSTFMVEMTETARILNHATGRSLIVLDEIGRGTSTLDGLSLAWAIVETLAGEGREVACAAAARPPHEGPPRTLFATHYHELTDLEERLPGRVKNLHVSVREWGEEIVFLHRILPGRTDRSYGIHVAKLAGMPPGTIARAKDVLESLAVHHHGPAADAGAAPKADANGVKNGSAAAAGRRGAAARVAPRDGQLSLFTEYVQHPAVDRLRGIAIDTMSPMQAFDTLRELKALIQPAKDGAARGV